MQLRVFAIIFIVLERAAVVLATPVVATAVSPAASPVDSTSVRRPKHLESRPKIPTMHVT